MKKILIVEDEDNIRELVTYNLKANGYQPIEAADGISGITMVYREKPDLILLDLMLPKKDGYEICRDLRAEGNNTPIIMLTAKSEEFDKVLGLEFGADDYLTKPFGIRELMARIKAVLRRYDSSNSESIEEIIEGDLRIIPEMHKVYRKDKEIELTYKEYELLYFLVRNKGHVYRRDELLDKVWGIDYVGETRTVDVHVRYIRKKLGTDDEKYKYIETVRGRGYLFK